MPADRICISADSHVVEPPELFAPLQTLFGGRAPRIRVANPELGPQLDLGNGTFGLAIAGFFLANVDFKSPAARGLLAKGYELARPGVYDIKARLADQEADGLDAEVLYPSVIFNAYQLADKEILKAAFRAYNDWTAEYCAQAPGLRFVITEFEAGWTAIMLRRLDWSYIRAGGAATAGIPELPSHYWKQNFFVTFEDDDLAVRTRDVIDPATMLWGSDYPHGDSIFPNSQPTLARILGDCSPEERLAMTSKNVVELYKLPFEV